MFYDLIENQDGTQNMRFGSADSSAETKPTGRGDEQRRRSRLLRAVDDGDVRHARAQMEAEAVNHWPNPNEPTKVARKLVERKAFSGGSPLFWQEDWMIWTGSHWSRVGKNDVSSDLRKIFEKGMYLKSAKNDDGMEQTPLPWNPNRRSLGEVMDALRDISLVKSDTPVPAWISADGTVAGGHVYGDPQHWIAFKNGLFRWTDREFVACTREFFNESSLPFAYERDAPAPELWLRSLKQWFADDPEAIQLLQEWFGYVISGRTDLQAALYIQGVAGSGKSKVRGVLEMLIGKTNVGPMSTSQLTNDNFGLEGAIGKLLLSFPDATFGANARNTVEKFKEIIGGDAIAIRRKNRTDWSGTLPGRMMFTSNHAPHFPDNSGAPLDRLYTLAMNRKFRGTEAMNSGLDEELKGEASGILNWALDGLNRLNARGRFVQPESGREVLQDAAEIGSPLGAFVRESCEVGPERWVWTKDLYVTYRTWCEQNGHRPLASNKFGAELKSYMLASHPDAHRDKKDKGEDRKPTYYGLALKEPESRTIRYKTAN
ncbi:hypothetical protein CJ178_28470 [Rhodococcus sp. ACPA4]|uniref:DNA primase family protein n=1 Tax=Rhodococcus TaxID=1827 RepID=UPI000BB11D55|nr:phage/plasmid primase, P4 family [Rhodococcus sp. ACPA4]PBC37953.1 hypothetical protein CJ178_28470 [Rhodococcus sp. ACPA4]